MHMCVASLRFSKVATGAIGQDNLPGPKVIFVVVGAGGGLVRVVQMRVLGLGREGGVVVDKTWGVGFLLMM